MINLFSMSLESRPGTSLSRTRTPMKSNNKRGAQGKVPQNKSSQFPIYKFKRHVEMDTVYAGADGADTFQTYYFGLSQLPGYNEFSALFDQYRITKVDLEWLPVLTNYSANNFTTTATPASLRIFSVIDYNSVPTGSTINAMREYETCRVSQYFKGHKMSLKPKVVLDMDSGDNLAQYDSEPWLSTGGTGIYYYGVKIAVNTSWYSVGSIAPADTLLRCEAVFHLEFRHPK